MEHINTDGVVSVGEINTRAFREALVAEDYSNAIVAGQVRAYQETILWVTDEIRRAGPYDDTRGLNNLVTWLGDRIRSVQPATTEDPHA